MDTHLISICVLANPIIPANSNQNKYIRYVKCFETNIKTIIKKRKIVDFFHTWIKYGKKLIGLWNIIW